MIEVNKRLEAIQKLAQLGKEECYKFLDEKYRLKVLYLNDLEKVKHSIKLILNILDYIDDTSKGAKNEK